jgi:SHS2 domain-containing protein
MIPFEPFEHTADIGLRAYGHSLKEAFENAARGMFSIMVDLASIGSKEKLEVRAEANDIESLLVAWLNELLFIFDSRNMLFKDFAIDDWDETSHLRGWAYGEPVDPERHFFEAEIKACTYHKLKVSRNRIWTCQVIFDV